MTSILGERTRNGKPELQIRWDVSPEEITWEPRANMVADIPTMVDEFEKKQKDKN